MPTYTMEIFIPETQSWQIAATYADLALALYNWDCSASRYTGIRRELRVTITLMNSESIYK